jgi:hypothetical protein
LRIEKDGNTQRERSGPALTLTAKGGGMLEDALKDIGYALAVYAGFIGGYWLFAA